MHAVVVRVSINDQDEADRGLRENFIPRVSQAPGFVNGYWTRKDNTGLAMMIFESEDAATTVSEMIPSIVLAEDAATTVSEMLPSMVLAGVALESVEVREVVANA